MRRSALLAATAAMVVALTWAPAAHADATVEQVEVASFDGVKLDGWVIRPGGSEGDRLPAILVSTPYIGQCIAGGTVGPCWPTPETPADWAEHYEPVEHLIDSGYAVVFFSVRGTGASGGCWDDMGPKERRDQRVLVNWIAKQPWSNRRVGAMGLSYMSQTALAAAAMRPRALKTVVVSGISHDLYRFLHSPQGLAYSWGLTLNNEAVYGADISLLPPGVFRPNPALLAEGLQHHHQRICPEVVRAMAEPTEGVVTGDRDAAFWSERSLTRRLRRARASVLVAQGFGDLWQSGHAMQEDTIWSNYGGPRAMYLGQWGHSYPWQTARSPKPREDLKAEWLSMLDSWLGHYLKGGPKPAFGGRARFEDESGTWHESDRWPPRESRDEVLHLAPGERLESQPPASEEAFPFRSYPQLERTTAQEGFACPGLLGIAGEPGGQVFMTEPVSERTVIAGNPMAYLDLASDQPGGAVQVLLHDVGPDFSCESSPARSRPSGVRSLTIGGADLRFHHGGFDARPFTRGHVRIDIANLAAVLQPGHRLALSVSYGDPMEFAEVGHAPLIGIRVGPRADSSQIVVPVLEGGFGGAAPAVAYPPRP